MKTLILHGVANFSQIKLDVKSIRYYLVTAIFVLGTIFLPFVAHLFTINGIGAGQVLLPIYFFVLIGGFQYGFNVAIITAIFGPLISYFIIDMPGLEVLPIVLIKSSILAISSSYIAGKIKKLNMLYIFLAVISYQIIGTFIEFFLRPDSFLLDFRFGYIGIILHILLGFLLLVFINKFINGKKES